MHAPPTSCPPIDTGLTWHNSFHALGPDFHSALAPQPLSAPYWVGRCEAVADALGLQRQQLQSDALLQALAGNQPISGAQPLASVYSGHQFGQWAGQLGDGRALLLGQTNGLEVQLKGSGLTPYSRMGDGRAVLRSSIREFLCSEAMHGLGIATTRALCVVGSDDQVWRESAETAAVVTRVAPSFIRFGHFEHFAARQQIGQLKQLADFVIDAHYPACRSTGSTVGKVYADLLQCVTERTACMIARWQAVGFCHGVMNTDNMSILGLTLDYGPFQFLDAYDPGHICNHTDQGGRYAFGQQPSVANWNLYCLGQALMPLIEEPQLALNALAGFKPVFQHQLHQLMCAKLGLLERPDSGAAITSLDLTLWSNLLQLLAQNQVDYSIFWHRLSLAQASGNTEPVRDLFLDRAALDHWMLLYSERTAKINTGLQADLMLKVNPKYVLRNYLAEEAIAAAKAKDFTPVADLLKVLQRPYDEHPEFQRWADFPPDWASDIAISCSS